MCDCNKLDNCIRGIMELEEPMAWRDLTEWEIKNNVFDLGKTLQFAEGVTSAVIGNITKKFIDELLASLKYKIEEDKDLANITLSISTIHEAISEIAFTIRKTYIDGHKSLDKNVRYNDKWLRGWSIRKAEILVKKIETDLVFKLLNDVYDKEVAE